MRDNDSSKVVLASELWNWTQRFLNASFGR